MRSPAPLLASALVLGSVVTLTGCPRRAVSPADGWLAGRCAGEHAEPVRIGVLLPTSGKFRWYGEAALAGVRIGAGEDGALRLLVRDTAGDPDQAVRELVDLVENHQVAAVIGPMFRDEALTTARKAQELNVPLIALSGVEELAATGPHVFRNFLSRKSLVEQLAGHAMEVLGARTFAVVHPEEDYGTTYLALFRDEIERRGGRIVKVIPYAPDVTDLSTAARTLVDRHDLEKRDDFVKKRRQLRWKHRNDPLKLKQALENLVETLTPVVEFDAVFVPDDYEKVALFAPALAAVDVALKTQKPEALKRMQKALGRREIALVYLLGTEAWNHEKLATWAGRYLQGAVFLDGFFAGSRRETTRAFVDAYRKQHEKVPEMIAAHAHDAAALLRDLVSLKPPCSADELREALTRVEGFEGATGTLSFDADGNAHKTLFLLEVRGGTIVEKDVPAPGTS